MSERDVDVPDRSRAPAAPLVVPFPLLLSATRLARRAIAQPGHRDDAPRALRTLTDFWNHYGPLPLRNAGSLLVWARRAGPTSPFVLLEPSFPRALADALLPGTALVGELVALTFLRPPQEIPIASAGPHFDFYELLALDGTKAYEATAQPGRWRHFAHTMALEALVELSRSDAFAELRRREASA